MDNIHWDAQWRGVRVFVCEFPGSSHCSPFPDEDVTFPLHVEKKPLIVRKKNEVNKQKTGVRNGVCSEASIGIPGPKSSWGFIHLCLCRSWCVQLFLRFWGFICLSYFLSSSWVSVPRNRNIPDWYSYSHSSAGLPLSLCDQTFIKKMTHVSGWEL